MNKTILIGHTHVEVSQIIAISDVECVKAPTDKYMAEYAYAVFTQAHKFMSFVIPNKEKLEIEQQTALSIWLKEINND